MAQTKTLVLLLAGVVLFGLLVCGGGGAYWYLKYYRAASVPDVGPLAGQALSLPADSGVLAGFDVRAFFASAGYKQIATGDLPDLAKTQSPEEAERTKKEIREGIEKGLKEAEEKTGIRVDRDLDRVVVAASSVGAEKPEVAVIAVGRFDRAKVTRALEASAKTQGATVTAKTVEGVAVQVITEPGKPGAEIAFLDDSTLVAGTAAVVEAVVTNHAKGVRPLESNAGLLGLVRGLDAASGYWFVVDQSVIDRAQKEAAGAAPPVPLPHNLTLAGKFDGGMELTGEMADAAAAQSTVQMLEQGLGMLRGMAEQNPETQKIPGAKTLLDGIKVSAAAKAVKISIPSSGGGSAAIGGVLAAVAIPSLMRARVSANEAAAIGDIRTIISAEMVFGSASGGWYGDLGCLSEPKACLNGYSGPEFLDVALASANEKGGYKRVFHGGAAAGQPRGYRGFAYTATPATPGQTGVRSFCGDSSGLVCADPGGAEIVAQAGACPSTCAPLSGEAPMSPPVFAPEAEPPAAAPQPATPPPTRPAPVVRTPAPARTPAPLRTPAARPAPEAPAPPTAPAQPVRVGGQIREPKKVKNVSPFYPAMAKKARVQGIVILECTINQEGRVSDVKVLRSIPLLDQAAIDAVRQWEYEPTLLNGVPVPVIMTVTVNFQMR